MKKLLLVAAVITLLFVGGYVVYTGMAAPSTTNTQAPVVAQPQTAQPQPTSPPVTIVAATLNKDGIPTQIGSLPLAKSELGKDTLSEFAALHGDGFDLVNGYRADYAAGTSKATLWVGQAKDAATATKLADEMATKIGTGGNGMFSDLKPLTISNRSIYQVTGLGQLHFFYAVNDKIVWLAVDTDKAADGLHSIWSVLK